MLTAEEKRFLVKEAQSYYDAKQGNSESSTQIRKFCEMAKQASCYEEFVNFLQYQTGRVDERRERNKKEFRKGLIKKMEEIKTKVGEIKSLEAIAHFFGYMARYSKFKGAR